MVMMVKPPSSPIRHLTASKFGQPIQFNGLRDFCFKQPGLGYMQRTLTLRGIAGLDLGFCWKKGVDTYKYP